MVAPGFIDSHSHSDLQVLDNRTEKLAQGVTAEVVGNCGFSTFPKPADAALLYEFANGIFCGGEQWGWGSAREYLHDVGERCRVASVGALVGHGTLRIAVAGTRQGALTAAEMDQSFQMLFESVSQRFRGCLYIKVQGRFIPEFHPVKCSQFFPDHRLRKDRRGILFTCRKYFDDKSEPDLQPG